MSPRVFGLFATILVVQIVVSLFGAFAAGVATALRPALGDGTTLPAIAAAITVLAGILWLARRVYCAVAKILGVDDMEGGND